MGWDGMYVWVGNWGWGEYTPEMMLVFNLWQLYTLPPPSAIK